MDAKEVADLDALANRLVEGLALDVRIIYDRRAGCLTVAVRSTTDEAVGRYGMSSAAYSFKVASSEQNARQVRQRVARFLPTSR